MKSAWSNERRKAAYEFCLLVGDLGNDLILIYVEDTRLKPYLFPQFCKLFSLLSFGVLIYAAGEKSIKSESFSYEPSTAFSFLL